MKEVRSYGSTGVYGIYTGGTTGEWYAQDDATFERISRITCDEGHAVGLPVQIGCTAMSTRTARQRIRIAKRARADAIQIALPFWLELKDDEVVRFVREIADEAGKTPIILYLTSRSKRKLSPELLGRIAHQVPTFIGTKDTGCDVAGLKAMLKKAPDIAIFGGEDFFTKVPAAAKAAIVRFRDSMQKGSRAFKNFAPLVGSRKQSHWATRSTVSFMICWCRW